MRRLAIVALATLFLAAHCATAVPDERGDESRMKSAQGEFEVKLTPQAPDSARPWAPGRMLIDKQFHGALEATSTGEMLASMTAVEGSAGYVAMERVNGTLDGRRGTFDLQHNGTMNRGTQSLLISVVPDSGTGELTGLTGEMKIEISDGKHAYDFAYSLP